MEDIARVHQQLYGLRMQCAEAEEQLSSLRSQILSAERHLKSLETMRRRSDLLLSETTQAIEAHSLNGHSNRAAQPLHPPDWKTTQWPLPLEDYKRYGRQMILPEIGAQGQARLAQARVLIVGVGGLGCPAAAYLAGAGVGTIGLVDGDVVEMSNLHRQIAHSTKRIGAGKVDSAHAYLRELNPNVAFKRHGQHLDSESALTIFEQYDLILDCTDHPTTRYLISDACVLTRRPLVSASALKTEGQLIVLNNPPEPEGSISGGPCYRCIFPKPPPVDAVQSCGEGGILGPVVGVMGVLQALEAIKIITTPQYTPFEEKPTRTSMLMFSAYSSPQFRTIKMRSRRPYCAACSLTSFVDRVALISGSLDYAAFCGTTASSIDQTNQRISALELSQTSTTPTIIDTRAKTQFDICSLKQSINIPWTGDKVAWYTEATEKLLSSASTDVVLICRHGNDSQKAVALLQQSDLGQSFNIRDVRNGFDAWRTEVDPDWPEY